MGLVSGGNKAVIWNGKKDDVSCSTVHESLYPLCTLNLAHCLRGGGQGDDKQGPAVAGKRHTRRKKTPPHPTYPYLLSFPQFPYRTGFTPIVISWFFAPVVTAILAGAIYIVTRTCVLRRERSVMLAYYVFPLIFGITIFIVLLAVLLKGVKKKDLDWYVFFISSRAYVPCYHQNGSSHSQLCLLYFCPCPPFSLVCCKTLCCREQLCLDTSSSSSFFLQAQTQVAHTLLSYCPSHPL